MHKFLIIQNKHKVNTKFNYFYFDSNTIFL